MTLLPLVASIAILVLSSGHQDQTFDLTWKPTKGQQLDYRFSMKIVNAEGDFAIEGDLLTKVTKVEENGDYTVESISKNQRATVGGKEEAMDDDEEAETISYNAKGQKIEPQTAAAEDDTDPLTLNILDPITSFDSPAGPIKKGTKWTAEIKGDEKKHLAACKIDYEVIGEEKRGEFPCVRLEAKFVQTEGGSPAKADAHFLISTKDQTLVDFVVDIEGFKPDPSQSASTVKFSLIRK